MRGSPPLLLFVCSANVCRSPLAVALFRRTAASLVDDGWLRVMSAGSDARPGASRCEWSAAKAGADDDTADRGARPVDSPLLDDATAVFAADRAVMSALIRRSPAVRERTFTMKEAARLGRLTMNDSPDLGGGLGRLVEEMDARRGWVPIEKHETRRFRRRTHTWSTTFDVPDAHVPVDDVRHPVMYAELQPTITRLADVVAEVWSTT